MTAKVFRAPIINQPKEKEDHEIDQRVILGHSGYLRRHALDGCFRKGLCPQ
jgi:hypothetical protein